MLFVLLAATAISSSLTFFTHFYDKLGERHAAIDASINSPMLDVELKVRSSRNSAKVAFFMWYGPFRSV